jgi:hypothetical protein
MSKKLKRSNSTLYSILHSESSFQTFSGPNLEQKIFKKFLVPNLVFSYYEISSVLKVFQDKYKI